jgi:hypothetical protein
VFQGVVLTAVAQSTTIGCQQSWAPAVLSLIASLVTVVSVHFKLINYRELNARVVKVTQQNQDLSDQLKELRAKGKKFDFSWFDKRNREQEFKVLSDQELRAKGKIFDFSWFDKRKERKQEFKELNDFFYWATMSALVVFSAIILLCCILVLCGPHRHLLGT